MLSIDGARDLLRQFTDQAEDLIFVIDRAMGVRYLNQNATKSFEHLSGEIIGEPCTRLFPNGGSEAIQANARKIFESGGSISFEEKLVYPDRDMWLDTRLTPILDRGNSVLAVLGIARDISELKHREELISRSRREWLRAVDGMPYLLAVIGRDHRIERVNAAMAKRLGFSVRDAIGLTCHEKLHGSEKPPFFCPLINGGNDGGHGAEMLETHFGVDCISRVAPIRNGEGEPLGCLYIARDINELDRSMGVRRSSEEYMRMLLKGSEYTVFIQNPEGRYVFFSAMPGDRMPWDLVGRTPLEFFEPTVAARLVDRVKQVAGKGKELTEQVDVSWGTETLQFFDRVSPVRDALGRVKAVATISMKVGEFRRAPMEPPSPASGPSTLTAREREILRLIARGLTSIQIALHLDISRKTVETHRAKIMRKLDLHKTSALVSYAARSGLL